MLADTFTPVGIYLRLRDRFRDTILLESTDSHAAENSYSFIGVNAIGGIEISSLNEIEFKYPKQEPQKELIQKVQDAPDRIWAYMQQFEMQPSTQKEAIFAQGLYGYATYDAIPFFDTIEFKPGASVIPLMRYPCLCPEDSNQRLVVAVHWRCPVLQLSPKPASAVATTTAGQILIERFQKLRQMLRVQVISHPV